MGQTKRKFSQIAHPCAACKTLRKKCGEKCLLAPYFPPDNPRKFLIPRKIFGTRNVLKILGELEAEKREDAVNIIVYEATARLRDPVYGCTGVARQLQSKVSELQLQLETTQAKLRDLLKAQDKLASSMTGFYGNGQEINSLFTRHKILEETDTDKDDLMALEDLVDPFSLWERLWT